MLLFYIRKTLNIINIVPKSRLGEGIVFLSCILALGRQLAINFYFSGLVSWYTGGSKIGSTNHLLIGPFSEQI